MLGSIANARAADIFGFSGITEERNKTLLAIGKLVTELAKLCNFTPVVADLTEIQSGKVDKSGYRGLIIPFVVPKLVAPHYEPLNSSGASIFLAVYQYFNFVYCDVNRDIQQINLKLILQPFHKIVWAFLSVAAIAVTLTLWLTSSSRNNSRGDFPRLDNNGLVTAAFKVISGIFSATIVVNNRSKVLLLWLVICFILNNLYSGVLTSLLIAPLKQDVMRTVDDLTKRKYKFVYTNEGYFKNIVFMTQLMAASSPANSSLPFLSRGIQMKDSLPGLVRSLAFDTRTVLFGPFLLVMMYWKLLTENNEQRYRKTRNIKFRRYCHMGKELSSTYSIPEAWILVSNDQWDGNEGGSWNNNDIRKNGSSMSSNMLHLLFRLEANGIHAYWMHFFFRIQGTQRAQDLNRFKSKTETKEDIPVEPLGFHKGGVAVIFVLYAISVASSVVVLVCEFLCHSSLHMQSHIVDVVM